MKTIIFSDLHLNPVQGEFENSLDRIILRTIETERPDTLILNGDTFDLLFTIWFEQRRPAEWILQQILAQHQNFLKAVQRVQKVVFLIGEHDQLLLYDKNVKATLFRTIPLSEISDHWYDHSSKTLVFHGHQCSYDMIGHREDGAYLSLTPALTQILEEHLRSGNTPREEFIKAYVDQKLSFWYLSGTHSSFIRGMEEIYGCRSSLYYQRIAELLNSELFQSWKETLPSVLLRVCASICRLSAHVLGSRIRMAAPFYWQMLDVFIHRRYRKALETGIISYSPHQNLAFQNLVIGHDHRAFSRSYSGRTLFCTGSPKAQSWFERETLHTSRNGSFIVIEDSTVRQTSLPLFSHSCES